MFKLIKPLDRHTLKINFSDCESIDALGGYFDVLRAYCAETGLKPETVDFFFNYKFTEDGFKLQFYWDNLENIFVFSIPDTRYELISERLEKICRELNDALARKKYYELYGKLSEEKDFQRLFPAPL